MQAQPAAPTRDYREFFKKPETVREFWDAMQFEIEVGRYDLAARHLHGLLDHSSKYQITQRTLDAMRVGAPEGVWLKLNTLKGKSFATADELSAELAKVLEKEELDRSGPVVKQNAKNSDDLLAIESKEGMSAFLKLQTIPKWSADLKVEAQARKDVIDLIARINPLVKEKQGDEKLIEKLADNLDASFEERQYAVQELYKSGAVAMPKLIEKLRAATGTKRTRIANAILQLRDDTIPPLIAALDIDDNQLRMDLIDILRRRRATQTTPYMLYYAASPRQPETIRRKAEETAVAFLGVPTSRLPLARVALTKEAERYYMHQVKYPDPDAVAIWRWNGTQIVIGWPPDSVKVPITRAEEYYGLRFARWRWKSTRITGPPRSFFSAWHWTRRMKGPA